MIIDDIADLITELHKKVPAHRIAKIFNRERKWVCAIENGCTMRLDYDLICGLNKLGYDLKLVKMERRSDTE